MVRVGLIALAALCSGSAAVQAESPVWVTQVIHRVPQTEAEIVAAHGKSQAWCMPVPAGQEMLEEDLSGAVNYRVRSGGGSSILPCQTSRLGAINFGMDMAARDQAELPLLSGGAILERVNSDFLSIQVRLQQHGDHPPYLHYRPLAAVGRYEDHSQSHELLGIVEDSIRDVRSLGVYVPAGQPVDAATLRTLVIVHCSRRAGDDPETGALKKWKELEYLFVRAHVDAMSNGKYDVRLHSFSTTGNRSRLHYFKPFELPTHADDCGLKSDLVFTEYGFGSLYPAARAARKVYTNAQDTLTIDELSAFVAAQGLSGAWQDHLNLVLDAIIEGRLEGHADEVAAQGDQPRSEN